ncbi:hypothetical protein Prudu_006363 [Prunus dulcis]|uniref:Uncharacterized protein n=1 Tax=Prunus dulcis TaxID=3755 RepID=A0A4Y1QZJ5_PRUDU|nr:hypothetical protein Prudu_006363 [Prunus dulcis]
MSPIAVPIIFFGPKMKKSPLQQLNPTQSDTLLELSHSERIKTSCFTIIADAGGGDFGEWRKWWSRWVPLSLVVGRGQRGPVGLGRGVVPEGLRRKFDDDAFQGLCRCVPLRRLHRHRWRRWPASLWNPQDIFMEEGEVGFGATYILATVEDLVELGANIRTGLGVHQRTRDE